MELTWNRLPGTDAEAAIGQACAYLIAADARNVVLTRFTTGRSPMGTAAQAALNAITVRCALPEAEAGLREHMRGAAQRYENGEDVTGQPGWWHDQGNSASGGNASSDTRPGQPG
jgi:hypothetical protein